MNEETDLLSKLDELIKHMEQPGAVVPKAQCNAIIQEVNKQWDTADTVEKRVPLLAILNSVNNVLQSTMFGEDVEGFVEHRDKLYKVLLMSEVMIGNNVSTSRLVAVTEREVASGRMNEDHSLRQLAVTASAAPYMSDEELFQMANREKENSTGMLGTIKSFFK